MFSPEVALLAKQITCYAGDEDGEAAEPVQAALQLPQQLDLPVEVRRGLKRQWDDLQSTVQQLRPIERFRVVGVAFRRCCILLEYTAQYNEDVEIARTKAYAAY